MVGDRLLVDGEGPGDGGIVDSILGGGGVGERVGEADRQNTISKMRPPDLFLAMNNSRRLRPVLCTCVVDKALHVFFLSLSRCAILLYHSGLSSWILGIKI